jgi:hypothetical protein
MTTHTTPLLKPSWNAAVVERWMNIGVGTCGVVIRREGMRSRSVKVDRTETSGFGGRVNVSGLSSDGDAENNTSGRNKAVATPNESRDNVLKDLIFPFFVVEIGCIEPLRDA